jgi:hypothetical protein
MDQHEVAQVLADPVALELMASRPLTSLAYNGPDGAPRVIPIGYVWNGTEFVVCTTPVSPKVPALEANPAVALTIDNDEYPPHVLLVRGTAAVRTVPGVPDVYIESGRRSVPAEQFDAWQTTVRGLYPEMSVITITPTWAKILDFETRLPSAVAKLTGG